MHAKTSTRSKTFVLVANIRIVVKEKRANSNGAIRFAPKRAKVIVTGIKLMNKADAVSI